MRSILTTLDDTPACIAARTLAIEWSSRTGAALQGVAAIDMSDLERVEPVPVGGISYAFDRLTYRQKLAAERRSRIVELQTAFQQACSFHDVAAQCKFLEGDVKSGLLHQIEACDMAVTGRDAQFHLTPLAKAAPLVEYVVARSSRPLVVCGPSMADRGPVLVAYDGSAPAAKALQLAVLLGMFERSTALVMSIRPERAAAEQIANRARDFLTLHGVEVELDACASSVDPADMLMAHAREAGASLLVMGAFGHRGLREALFGSCTRKLCDSAPLPVFIYH